MSGRKRAAIYARISKNDLRDAHGTDAQTRRCEKLADTEGYDVVARLADDDLSGYSSKKPRPGYDRLLEMIDNREIDVVITWAVDRLTRQTRDLITLVDALNRNKVQVRTIQAGHIDLTTAGGRKAAYNLGVDAQYESELKSERNKLRHDELAREGGVNGGRPAYGYSYDKVTKARTIVPEQAAVIRDVRDRIIAGEPMRAIVNDLNRRGVPTVTGAQWHAMTLRSIMRGPAIAGLRTHCGTLYPASWEPIISVEDRARIVALTEKSTGNRGRPRRLLSGLARCGKCKSPLRSRRRSGRDNRVEYICTIVPGETGCGRLGIQGKPFEKYVIDSALVALGKKAVDAAAFVPPADTGVAAALAALDGRGKVYADMAAAGTIQPEDYAQFTAAIRDERTRLNAVAAAEVENVRTITITAEDVQVAAHHAEETGDYDRLRSLLEDVVADIVVGPGRVPVEDRVAINWRI